MTRAPKLLIGLSLLTACDPEGAATPSEDSSSACAGAKCDVIDDTGLDLATPAQAAVARLHADAVRDGTIDETELLELIAFAKHEDGTGPVTSFLHGLAGTPEVSSDAAAALDTWTSGVRPGHIPMDNDLYTVELGGSDDFVFDDQIFIHGDGELNGDTKILSHSRGFAQKRSGVLFRAHGSTPPSYPSTGGFTEAQRLRDQGPDGALDQVAKIWGLELDQFNTFDHLAHNVHFDPSDSTPFWAGLCHAWTYTALDNRINALVDVDGPEGQRGVWIFGQWLSRADLGNWMMGVANSLSIADAVLIDNFMTPEDLLKGVTEHVFHYGHGLRMDVWNDSVEGDFQIWNQPLVQADLSIESVADANVADAIEAFAKTDPRRFTPVPDQTTAKLVRIVGTWGVEANDGWEGPPQFRTSHWNMYVLLDDDGKVVAGYMAHTLADAGLFGLPETESDGLPDYIAYPKMELVDAAMAGAPNRLLEGASDGPRYRFFLDTVLARGIPDVTRRAFEDEVSGSTDLDAEDLAARYPGIANAYTPEQWSETFESRLGPGEDFGAVWGQGQQ